MAACEAILLVISPPDVGGSRDELAKYKSVLQSAGDDRALLRNLVSYPAHGRSILADATGRLDAMAAFWSNAEALISDTEVLRTLVDEEDLASMVQKFLGVVKKMTKDGVFGAGFQQGLAASLPVEEHAFYASARSASSVVLQHLVHKFLHVQKRVIDGDDLCWNQDFSNCRATAS